MENVEKESKNTGEERKIFDQYEDSQSETLEEVIERIENDKMTELQKVVEEYNLEPLKPEVYRSQRENQLWQLKQKGFIPLAWTPNVRYLFYNPNQQILIKDIEGFFWTDTEVINLGFLRWKERIEEFLETEEGQELLEKHEYEGDYYPYQGDMEFWEDVMEAKNETYRPPMTESRGRMLYGSWKRTDNGEFVPDKDGEFSAIYNPNHRTLQVVYSEYKIRCARTSPCYPYQGDVGTPPNMEYGNKLAYMLPPELLKDEYLEKMREYILDEGGEG